MKTSFRVDFKSRQQKLKKVFEFLDQIMCMCSLDYSGTQHNFMDNGFKKVYLLVFAYERYEKWPKTRKQQKTPFRPSSHRIIRAHNSWSPSAPGSRGKIGKKITCYSRSTAMRKQRLASRNRSPFLGQKQKFTRYT